MILIDIENMKTQLKGSVGHLGKNMAEDVKTVQALLNVYLRNNSLPILQINGICDESCVSAIALFQNKHMRACLQTNLVINNNHTHKGLQFYLDQLIRPQAVTKPEKGQMTWDAEGQEGGPFHSRRLHVPSGASGLTIGRGYDCKQKTSAQIKQDLLDAGFETTVAMKLSAAAGKYGNSAVRFIIDNDLLDFEVTLNQQLNLFKIIYQKLESELIRISSVKSNIEEFGEVKWNEIDNTIKDLIVDLIFRGDYTKRTRIHIQKHIAKNDLNALCEALESDELKTGIPADRIRRRVELCKK